MQRQRGEWVPIGDALRPGKSIRDDSRQARHSFTVADQVHLLVSAREADPDLGFMARTMALCSLPRSNPGNRLQYKRVNGPFTLYMTAGGGNKLPYGNLPRLMLAWVCTEAVRTRSRELVLGRSLSEFMRTLDIYSNSGRVHTRLRNQMKRLFGCTVTMVYEEPGGFARISSFVADKHEFWWNERKPDEPSLWESKIELGEKFFNEIVRHPVPIDMNTLTALKRSLCPPRSQTDHLAATIQPVWSAPGQGQRQQHRPSLPLQGDPGVEEDQAGLAGVELHDGSGPSDPAPFNPDHRTAQSRAARKLIPPFPASQWPVSGLSESGWTSRVAPRPESLGAANRLFPQACVIRDSFPRAFG